LPAGLYNPRNFYGDLFMADKREGVTKCLGWCGQSFVSPDKTKLRFCKKCTTKKEHLERNAAKIRSFGDGVGKYFTEH
jgi:hypothetical protein